MQINAYIRKILPDDKQHLFIYLFNINLVQQNRERKRKYTIKK